MRIVFRNFHVIVFACLSICAALWVANNPKRAVMLARPMVEDAIELKTMTHAAYQEIRDFDWRGAYGEFVSLYVAAMRLPSLVFERLAERLDEVNDDVSKRADSMKRVDANRNLLAIADHPHADAMASAMP